MILVDRRTGSGELAGPLRAAGCPVEVCTLDYGDVAFIGNGPGNEPVAIGIERKTLNDMLTSIQNLRWAGHQLPGLCESYGWVWLIIEGLYRPETGSGALQSAGSLDNETPFLRGKWFDAGYGRNRFMYRELDHYLTTLETHAAVRVRRSSNEYETVKIISSLYSWWTTKDYDEHRSHLALDTIIARDSRLMIRPSVPRMIAAQLPGVGYEKSEAVVRHFGGSVRTMVQASVKDWMAVKGIGKTLASKIVEVLK